LKTLFSNYILTKLAIPHLEKVKGNIVMVSSVASILTDPKLAPYQSSKAALDHLVHCFACDLSMKGIRVNAVW
jgi:NAD(P)-dependent dehydrogenase (short-subunit alcohol dehydrogenase family)